MASKGYYTTKFKELRKEWGGVCQMENCNRKFGLQFAHIRPTGISGMGRGQPQRYHDIKKNPDCYMLMCVPCHSQMDDSPEGLSYTEEAPF